VAGIILSRMHTAIVPSTLLSTPFPSLPLLLTATQPNSFLLSIHPSLLPSSFSKAIKLHKPFLTHIPPLTPIHPSTHPSMQQKRAPTTSSRGGARASRTRTRARWTPTSASSPRMGCGRSCWRCGRYVRFQWVGLGGCLCGWMGGCGWMGVVGWVGG
jgi:hypothetical protein